MVASMANSVGASAGVVRTDLAASCVAGGSEAVATAIEIFSAEYVAQMKKLRARISTAACDALVSANDYSEFDAGYATTFQLYLDEVG